MAITLDGSNANTVGVVNTQTAKATTSGTAIDFTGIPAGVRRITLMLDSVSTNGASRVLIRLGTAAGVAASGYAGASSILGTGVGTVAYSTGFEINGGALDAATGIRVGGIRFLNVSGNTWVCEGVVGWGNGTGTTTMGGDVTLTGTLDRVRITTVNGTDTFDAGLANILYE